MLSAASLVVPDASDLIQFALVVAIACLVIGDARLVRARRATQAADLAAPLGLQRVTQRRRFRARVWAGVGGSMTGYAGVMLAGPIALGDRVQPLWVGLLVVGVGCVAWNSHLRQQHSSPTA
ncbi:MAG: hypothetical protein RLZZ362_154 [Actinomycetota bacterium]